MLEGMDVTSSQAGGEGAIMNVRDGMTNVVLTVGPAHTLREASRQMSARRVGAAVVTDSEHAGIGILTERDILPSVGAGQDPDTGLFADPRTSDVGFPPPDMPPPPPPPPARPRTLPP